MHAPTTPAEFDRAYRAPITPWGDARIPPEVEALAQRGTGTRVLELGCGLGRFSRYLARQGLRATGVDFSPVAIAQAKARVANDAAQPHFQVGDVTRLDDLEGPFDCAFDVGCFHCLDPQGQAAYAAQVSRLLVPGGAHWLWALDTTPSDLRLTPQSVSAVFVPAFALRSARRSRRRIMASHWYELVRARA